MAEQPLFMAKVSLFRTERLLLMAEAPLFRAKISLSMAERPRLA